LIFNLLYSLLGIGTENLSIRTSLKMSIMHKWLIKKEKKIDPVTSTDSTVTAYNNHTNGDMPVIHGVESNKINKTKGKRLINYESLKPLMQIVFKNYNNNS